MAGKSIRKNVKKSLVDALDTKNPLTAYKAIRDDVAQHVMTTQNETAYAAMVKSLLMVVDKIAELEHTNADSKKKDALNVITMERKRRKAAN